MVNSGLFAKLVPLKSLVPQDRSQLAKQSSVLSYGPGQSIFGSGELARTQAYLIAGEIELTEESGRTVLRAGEQKAQYPLAPGSRRSASAVARTPSQILFVDRELVDLLLTWSQTGGLEGEVQHKHDSIDWMTALLQSKAFTRIPPANIAQILSSLEPVSFFPGDVILKQGDVGDYYYVITDGRVQVLLEDEYGQREEELAQLGVGRAFGEEALVSGEPRNATVRALTRCALMRLSGAAFAKLLKAPLLKEITLLELPSDATVIDVRLQSEFAHGHLPGARNIQLSAIRDAAGSLDPKLKYVVYCDTGRRSASATFLLSERGFNASVIRGGVPPSELKVIDPPLAA
jgi:CRP-like cAMP-binding protein